MIVSGTLPSSHPAKFYLANFENFYNDLPITHTRSMNQFAFLSLYLSVCPSDLSIRLFPLSFEHTELKVKVKGQ